MLKRNVQVLLVFATVTVSVLHGQNKPTIKTTIDLASIPQVAARCKGTPIMDRAWIGDNQLFFRINANAYRVDVKSYLYIKHVLYDVPSGKVLLKLNGPASMSPDGKRIAVLNDGKRPSLTLYYVP